MARIPIKRNNPRKRRRHGRQARQQYLKAEIILKYLLQTSDDVDTLIKCNPSNVRLVTTDQSLYEALGSVKNYDDINLRNLVKFLEVVDVVSFREKMRKPRKILSDARVEQLRKLALKEHQGKKPEEAPKQQKKEELQSEEKESQKEEKTQEKTEGEE